MRGPPGNGVTPGITNGANPLANGHVNGTASVPRTRTSTPLPAPMPSTSAAASNEATHAPVYAGGVWVSRFIGGWGEAFYGDPSAGRGAQAVQTSSANEAEDDGRECVSCGWGWGHDGSAFEVISVEVVEVSSTLPFLRWSSADVEQNQAHVASGLGRRNQAQRHADVLGPPSRPASPLGNVTNVRKRRRLNVDFEQLKKVGAAESAVLADEVRMIEVRTISFGIADARKCKTGQGYVFVSIEGKLMLIFTGTNMTP